VLLASAMLAIALPGGSASGNPPTLVYPDLVSDPPGIPHGQDGKPIGPSPYSFPTGSPPRLLLRFNGFIHNQGPGAFELQGSSTTYPTAPWRMTAVQQRVFDDNGGSAYQDSLAVVKYETNDDHQHFHFMDASKYSLWDQGKNAEVSPASKIGFCLGDSLRLSGNTPAHYGQAGGSFCEYGHPESASVTMGVSAGWRDDYGYQLALQWVDVSDVLPGQYWLRSDIDPDGVIAEGPGTNSPTEVNPPGWAGEESIVPGYVAQALDLGQIPNAPNTFSLPTATFGSPGTKERRIVQAPAHGQLNHPLNTWFTGQVTYTPNPGYKGPDTFKFEAHDSSSSFPTHPAQAVVTMSVGDPPAPGVVVSGAPAHMYAGTSVQLHADLTGPDSGVTWTADHGSVSSSGLYTAPGSPPLGGVVHVTATRADGPSNTVGIVVDPPPKQIPAPIAKPVTPSRTGNPLSPLHVLIHGRHLMVTTSSRDAGKLSIAVRGRTRRRLAWCRARMPRLAPVTCRMRLPAVFASASRSRGRRLRVKAVLRVGKHVVAIRRSRVRVTFSEHAD
jgi:Lysyl oxidase